MTRYKKMKFLKLMKIKSIFDVSLYDKPKALQLIGFEKGSAKANGRMFEYNNLLSLERFIKYGRFK